MIDLNLKLLNPDELYSQLRNLPIIHSPEYYAYLGKKFPGYDRHHLTGSQGPIKLNDMLVVPIASRQDHNNIADKNRKIFCINNLVYAIRLQQEFTMEILGK